jgi:hypothetical protein
MWVAEILLLKEENMYQHYLKTFLVTPFILLGLTACVPSQTAASQPSTLFVRPTNDPCPASANLEPSSMSGAWYATITPSEHFNSERTHVFPLSCVPSELTRAPKSQVQTRQTTAHLPSPYNIVTRERDELFVYGGAYGDQPNATGSFVSRLEPETLEPVWNTQLINARAEGRWNYPGVIAVHGNGDLYAIFGDQLARLESATGEVKRQITLPSPAGAEARDISYNGFTVLEDGTLVAKSIGRGRCDLEGFTALLQCDQSKFPPSVLVAIEPETLGIVSRLEMHEPAFGRITSTTHNGQQVVYVAGYKNILRYLFRDEQLVLDLAWGPVPYLLEGQTPASAIAVIGDYIALQTNASPAKTAMSLVVISQMDSSVIYNLQPFKDTFAFKSFLPSMVSVDPENNRIYSQDAGAGQLAAIDLTERGLTVAWRVPQHTLSFTTLVGTANNRIIIGTDIPGIRTPAGLRDFSREQVVWRDAATGNEVARSPDLPPLTSGALVTPGFHGVWYYPVLKGGLIELSFKK